MTSLDYQEFKKGEREEPSIYTEPNDIGALLRDETAPIDFKYLSYVLRVCRAHAV